MHMQEEFKFSNLAIGEKFHRNQYLRDDYILVL